jgi:hypothetical protein
MPGCRCRAFSEMPDAGMSMPTVSASMPMPSYGLHSTQTTVGPGRRSGQPPASLWLQHFTKVYETSLSNPSPPPPPNLTTVKFNVLPPLPLFYKYTTVGGQSYCLPPLEKGDTIKVNHSLPSLKLSLCLERSCQWLNITYTKFLLTLFYTPRG